MTIMNHQGEESIVLVYVPIIDGDRALRLIADIQRERAKTSSRKLITNISGGSRNLEQRYLPVKVVFKFLQTKIRNCKFIDHSGSLKVTFASPNFSYFLHFQMIQSLQIFQKNKFSMLLTKLTFPTINSTFVMIIRTTQT